MFSGSPKKATLFNSLSKIFFLFPETTQQSPLRPARRSIRRPHHLGRWRQRFRVYSALRGASLQLRQRLWRRSAVCVQQQEMRSQRRGFHHWFARKGRLQARQQGHEIDSSEGNRRTGTVGRRTSLHFSVSQDVFKPAPRTVQALVQPAALEQTHRHQYGANEAQFTRWSGTEREWEEGRTMTMNRNNNFE